MPIRSIFPLTLSISTFPQRGEISRYLVACASVSPTPSKLAVQVLTPSTSKFRLLSTARAQYHCARRRYRDRGWVDDQLTDLSFRLCHRRYRCSESSSSPFLPFFLLTSLSNCVRGSHNGTWNKRNVDLKEYSTRRRSPYAVLKITTKNPTKEDVKAAFRRLVKKHHPDLNPPSLRDESERRTSELVEAYQQLLVDYDNGTYSSLDSRLAIACEIYTIRELKMSPLYDVHSFRVHFVNDNDGGCSDNERGGNFGGNGDMGTGENLIQKNGFGNDEATKKITGDIQVLGSNPLMEMSAHPEDSISDVKRHLQTSYGSSWGLEGRRKDRDGIYSGWELVAVDDDLGEANKHADGGGSSSSAAMPKVLSYHLFLSSYSIQIGDILHAVIRRNEDSRG